MAGFAGIVVTLDTWVTGWRPRDLASGSFPQLRGHCLANYTSDERFRELAGGDVSDPRNAVLPWTGVFGHSVRWDDLTWMREATRLPLILKGICHPDDARRAVDAGADSI